MPLLKDKVALITGSTRGIGWATAKLFAQNGCQIVLNGRSNQELLDKRVSELKKEFGVEVIGILADFGDFKQIADCYQQIFKQFKQLDIVVNNAGIMEDALLGMISEKMMNQTFNINAMGVLYSIQGAARIMSRKHQGSIINVSSIIGTNGNTGQLVYSSTKAAVIGATKSASKELAPKNIRVNCVAPGFIQTDMTHSLPEDKFQERVSSIKMGRIGQPEDIAKTILFLASPMSEYVTGQVIGVDGGMLI